MTNHDVDEGIDPSAQTQRMRRARKRVTDRNAQRAHRNRAKQYTESLEEQVAELQEQLSLRSESALFEDNTRLREEIKSLRSTLAKIGSVAGNSMASFEATQIAIDQPLSSALPCGNSTESNSTVVSEGLNSHHLPSNEVLEDQQHDIRPEPINQSHNIDDILFSSNYVDHGRKNSANLTNQTQERYSQLISSLTDSLQPLDLPEHLNNNFTQYHTSQSHDHFDLRSSYLTAIDEDSFDIYPIELDSYVEEADHVEYDHPLNRLEESTPLTNRAAHSASLSSLVQLHRVFPYVLHPPGPQDIDVHEIIERARSKTLSERILLPKPTMVDFFLDGDANVLSADLKKYLQPVGLKRRTAEYLASYWIIFLYLRWQVNQNFESFNQVPKWFRPTELQISSQHPIFIDLIFWPYMRDELILLAQNDPEKAYDALINIGTYFKLNLDSSSRDFSDKYLDQTASDLGNWRLTDDFFEIYPQWRNSYQRSISEFQN